MSNRVRDLVCASLVASVALACGSDAPPDSTKSPTPPDATAEIGAAATDRAAGASAQPAKSEPKKAKPHRNERPLPAFSGWTLDNERLDISSLIGKRLVIFFFNPEVEAAAKIAQAMRPVSAQRADFNFEIVGIATASTRQTATEFVAAHGIDFPVIDDSTAKISRRFGLQSPQAMLGVDADGYVVFGFAQFATQAPNAVELITDQIRESLRLPGEAEDDPFERPLAPTFTAQVLDQSERFDLAAQRGKAVVLLFFLHTCPHCHDVLRYMKRELADLPEDKQPVFVGVELTGKTHSVREQLKQDGLDYFPVLFEDGGEITRAYGVFGGVPDMVLIDAEGRIDGRIQGWRAEIEGPLMRMRLAKLVGAPVPLLLKERGYSGSEVCGVCHEPQHDTWLLTKHSRAFDTLVKHGADSDPECVGCHVVGFEQSGGFEISPRTIELEDVGCESCHGRGGPHQSPTFVTAKDYAPACLTCHNKTHSLGFEYASFVPKISHAANAEILALPAAERKKILAERGALRGNLLPTTADHVGSEACKSCHAKEFETWSSRPHAKAIATLEQKDKSADAACLKCHTTGFGYETGFPEDGVVADHPDLARVGCESCHGPGGDHVKEGSVKLGTIVSLGDKCDSCVILKICGSCHDDANDPGFEFEVQDKIDRIRHGTIEAGTGRPLSPDGRSARSDAPDDAALLARAFALDASETAWIRP